LLFITRQSRKNPWRHSRRFARAPPFPPAVGPTTKTFTQNPHYTSDRLQNHTGCGLYGSRSGSLSGGNTNKKTSFHGNLRCRFRLNLFPAGGTRGKSLRHIGLIVTTANKNPCAFSIPAALAFRIRASAPSSERSAPGEYAFQSEPRPGSTRHRGQKSAFLFPRSPPWTPLVFLLHLHRRVRNQQRPHHRLKTSFECGVTWHGISHGNQHRHDSATFAVYLRSSHHGQSSSRQTLRQLQEPPPGSGWTVDAHVGRRPPKNQAASRGCKFCWS